MAGHVSIRDVRDDEVAKRITALVERDHPWATGFWDAAGYDLDEGMARYVRNL